MAFDTTNLIPRLIDLDFKQVKFCSVSVEQYDKDSSYIEATLYDGGSPYIIPVGSTVSFGGTKPSSHIVLETAVIENNKIYYKISEQCTVKEGDYPVKFTLYLPNGAVKYTQEFKIQVRKAVISSDAVADVDEVNVLNELIVDASQAIVDADTATTNATTATGLANTATTNANNATTSANNAANLANEKAGLANTATINANIATGLANTATLNANNARYMGEYVGLTAYKVSNIVKYGNALYICKVNSTGNLPTNTTYWDISSKQFNWRGIYDNTTPYTALDAIYYLGSSYICKQNSTGNIPTNTTYFDPLSLKGDKGATLSPKGSYNPLITYVLDDLVNHNASVWQCLVESTGVEPTEGANWTIFLTGGGAIGDLGTLNTTDKTTAVSAINEVNTKVGNIATLTTTQKSSTVGAINELDGQIGDLTQLETTSNTDLVGATNENVTKISANTARLSDVVHLSDFPIQGAEADDTPRLQRAINYARDNKKLLFNGNESKTFYISSPLYIDDYVRIDLGNAWIEKTTNTKGVGSNSYYDAIDTYVVDAFFIYRHPNNGAAIFTQLINVQLKRSAPNRCTYGIYAPRLVRSEIENIWAYYNSCDYAAYGYLWCMIPKFNNIRLDEGIRTWVLADDGVTAFGSTSICAKHVCGTNQDGCFTLEKIAYSVIDNPYIDNCNGIAYIFGVCTGVVVNSPSSEELTSGKFMYFSGSTIVVNTPRIYSLQGSVTETIYTFNIRDGSRVTINNGSIPDYSSGTPSLNYPLALVDNSHCILNQTPLPTNGNAYIAMNNESTLVTNGKNGTTFNKYNGSYMISQYDGQYKIAYGTAVPIDGTWNKGDIFRITGETWQPYEYVCQTAGTPGVWKMSKYVVFKSPTYDRPFGLTTADYGLIYIDTSLAVDGKPILWNGETWVDATGTVV